MANPTKGALRTMFNDAVNALSGTDTTTVTDVQIADAIINVLSSVDNIDPDRKITIKQLTSATISFQ